MKVSRRILAPVLLAVLCAAVLVVYLWWELKSASGLLGQIIPQTGTGEVINDTGTLDDIDPRDQALLHLRQGDLHAIRGEWKEAETEYKASVESGGGLTALKKLAKSQLQRRKFDEVRVTMRELKNADARAEDLLLLDTSLLLRTGELVGARKQLDESEESPQKHYGLAMLGIIEGNHASAQQHLKEVEAGWDPLLRSYAKTLLGAYDEYALFPESTDAHLISLLSRALAQVEECELALPLLVQVTHTMENYRDAWVVQGFCELTTERPEQALASMEHAYGLDPQKPEIQYFLARAYIALGQHDNAITFLEYALANGFYPESEVRNTLAMEALAANKPDLALAQYDAMTSAEDATLEAYNGFITVSLILEKKQEAYLKAQEAVEKWPNDGAAYDLLGWAAQEAGMQEEADAAFERAQQLNPALTTRRGTLEE